MRRNFRTYPDSDDPSDILIGYRHVADDEPEPLIAPEPLPSIPGDHYYTGYILAFARECQGEFTVNDMRTRYGLPCRGASFYATLTDLVDAGLIARRVGRSNTSFLRSTEATR